MGFAWTASQLAFTDAALWFVNTCGRVGDRWDGPGLGEWDLRALAGHTSRALLTVEAYLARPATAVELDSAVGYFRAAQKIATDSDVANRGRDAGAALGTDPQSALEEIAARVIPLIQARNGTELVTTIAGGMRLADYLPTRIFELAVHTADISTALGLAAEVPDTVATRALHVASDLAVAGGLAGPLLLGVTGRSPLPQGFTVL